MKYLLLLCVMAFASCNNGLSDEDRRSLQFHLDLRNQSLQSKYRVDSIEQAGIYRRELMSEGYSEEKYQALSAIKMNGYYEEVWNNPYKIEKDTGLTLQKYLDYCRNYQKDPKTFIQFIN